MLTGILIAIVFGLFGVVLVAPCVMELIMDLIEKKNNKNNN